MTTRRITHYPLIAAACLAVSGTVHADLTPPPGLNPGDQYRIAFVTSDAFLTNAVSTDISIYNQLATDAANSQTDLAALGTDWFAIVSEPGSPGISAKENTGTDDSPAGDNGVPIFRVDGVGIADHYDDLWDRTIDAPLNITETGTASSATTAWTGTTADGEINTAQPLGSTFLVGRGQIGATGDLWMGTFGGNGNNLAPIYVISDVLTVPAVSIIVGDYDNSGQVEQGDLDIVLQNWGTGTFTGDEATLVGGGPFDGTVDQNELDGVLQNWGNTAAPDFSGSVVPEPATLALAGLFGLAMARRRLA